ncbi:prepilin peptidase [Paraliobacillus quinghaiensis]|uniref:Prepilin peptidase n=1 Tax=Paraliobacillus quinghaiensis TaxID=470815 RepID=A0A917WTH0_9BACI|nr:A24 family peptidase [Paraliobacillus quinghaiensis]GGM27306.1 prepilin peptidase [Paraliobacillus quinghaiensis]
MELYYIVVFFIFGSVFGSFYNVVGLRVPQNSFFQSDRSYCPRCEKTLHWYELLPIISYVIQTGKCRNCKNRISPLYPTIELSTAILFSFSYYLYGFDIDLVMALLLTSLCVIIIVSDITYMLIPNKILLVFLPILIIVRIIDPIEPWWSSLVGAAIGFILLMVIILVSKGGMGAGDMKLFTLLGIVLGYKGILLTFFLSTIFGTIITILLLLTKRINRKSAIPFGPYICLASLTTFYFGNEIINWYITSFF